MDLTDACIYLNKKLNQYGADNNVTYYLDEEIAEIYNSLIDIPELVLVREKFKTINITDKDAVVMLVNIIIEMLEVIEASQN